jgi:ATP-dependent exoDNAse (exonuclease V) alpha subunit
VVKGFAPTGKAAMELADSAQIAQCETIDKFLLTYKNTAPENRSGMFNLNNECWIVDEAGMCGSRKIREFMDVAEKAGAKVIFVGDRKQFASIEAGRMFSELQDKSGIDMVIMPEVMRQKTQQTKDIVKAISLKDTDFAFDCMRGRIENYKDKSDYSTYKEGQTLLFTEDTDIALKGTNAKVAAVHDNYCTLSVFDKAINDFKSIDVDLRSRAQSFIRFDSKYENVITQESDRVARLEKVAQDYIENMAKGNKTLVITATNTDRKEINQIIRQSLVGKGKVDQGQAFTVYESNNVGGTSASFSTSYAKGQIVVFNGRCGDIPRGTQGEIQKINDQKNTIVVEWWDKKVGKFRESEFSVPENCKNFSTYNRKDLNFAVNDQVVFLKNDRNVGVRNGQLATIEAIDEGGNVTARLGKHKTVTFNISNHGDKAYTYIDHAYCLSEYKSQGATIDRLVWHAPSTGNISSNSFYVAITRCKNEVAVYTDDVEKLQRKVKEEQMKYSTLDSFSATASPVVRIMELKSKTIGIGSELESAAGELILSGKPVSKTPVKTVGIEI